MAAGEWQADGTALVLSKLKFSLEDHLGMGNGWWPWVGFSFCASMKRLERAKTRVFQRRRDDNINKICVFFEGGVWGQKGKSSRNAIFLWKRHDNKILNLIFLLSRNFVVIAQAPSFKDGHARVETRALKTLACRNDFWTSFQAMVDSVSVRFKNARVEKMPLNVYSGMREPLACRSAC